MNCKLIFMLLVLSACGEGTVKDSNIPWYISERIKDGTVQNYNYPDSLKKYQELSSKEISNQNKYKSYIVDLEFRIGNKSTEKLKSEFELLFKSDKATICDEIIKPGLAYISPNDRPSRRYSRPYITALDIDYFIDKCLECNLIEDSLSTPQEIAKLHLSNISLNDQWFRMPSRKKMPEIQQQYDLQNLEKVDQLYKSRTLNLNDEYVRHIIYILLLHSEDCAWTKKWLEIYFENCNDYPKYKDNLNHFLRRSICEGDDIVRMVKNELKKL